MKYFIRLEILSLFVSLFIIYFPVNNIDVTTSYLLQGTTMFIDTTPQIPLQKFKGEWVLKDNIFENNTKGIYHADVNPNRSFIAGEGNTNTSIIWKQDFDGLKVDIFWAYDFETKTVHHLSNTSTNSIGWGNGPMKENGDMDIKLKYPGTCETCSRVYSFRWIDDNQFFFRSTFYEGDRATGDYYGGTFMRKTK